jgi:hypothetical protein
LAKRAIDPQSQSLFSLALFLGDVLDNKSTKEDFLFEFDDHIQEIKTALERAAMELIEKKAREVA